jgi:hypothetical protein
VTVVENPNVIEKLEIWKTTRWTGQDLSASAGSDAPKYSIPNSRRTETSRWDITTLPHVWIEGGHDSKNRRRDELKASALLEIMARPGKQAATFMGGSQNISFLHWWRL